MFNLASGRNGMKKSLTPVLAIALALTAALPGCSDPENRAIIDKDAAAARNGLEQTAHPDIPIKHYNPLVVSDKVWAGNTALHLQRGLPLPERFETSRGITIVSSEPMTIPDIMGEIQRQTGITIHVPEITLRPVGTANAAAAAAVAAAASGSVQGRSMIMNGGPGAMNANAMPIAYEGPLSGLLDRVTGYFGLNWHYDGSIISISAFETKVFTIEALPGTQEVHDGMQDDNSSSGGSSAVAGGASSSSNQNSVTQNSKFSIDLKYWEELDKVVTSMLGGVGSVVVSPSLGTVTVTTREANMQQIAKYLTEENQRISRQIAVNVEIYSVTLSKGLDFNIAFNTALHRIANFSGNINGAAAPTTVSGFTGGGALSLAILNPNTHASEVSDIFTALSGIGDTTKVARFPLITLNNRPVSRRVGKDVSYVASATSNTTGSGSASTFAGTTLTPGTVHQGFSVQLTPRLLDDGRILLQYSLSIIDVLSIDSFNSVTGAGTSTSSAATQGSSTIELPTTSNRIFVQQSVLKSGSTLFLGGAEEDDTQQNAQGVGDPNNYALGGGISSGATHTMVFFALTPEVLDTPHSEQE
jgi:type IVB pilus formation R64 PilN family outer membrane protein